MKQQVKHSVRSIRVPLLGIACIVLICSSCVEEYMPELGSRYDEVLVVDGRITNDPGPYVVSLSLSTSIERPQYRPQEGYDIKISDDAGNVEVLTDNQDGTYTTHPDGIQGIPGRSYKISITSPEGRSYESEFEKMPGPVEIDTMWTTYEVREDIKYDHMLEGLQFYVSTKQAEEDTTYFLWDLTATYQYKANHTIKYLFDGQMNPFPKFDSLQTCWRTHTVHEIFTQSTMHVSEPYLTGVPLHYVNTEDKKLSIRYSLYAEQLVISSKAYEFWKSVKELNTGQGALYANQPYQIRGNVFNISDPDELVLGYFMTTAVTDYRFFVNRPWYATFYYPLECYLITEDLFTVLWSKRSQWPLYLTASYSGGGQGPALPASQNCVDCREDGGSIIKPEFWIDINHEK